MRLYLSTGHMKKDYLTTNYALRCLHRSLVTRSLDLAVSVLLQKIGYIALLPRWWEQNQTALGIPRVPQSRIHVRTPGDRMPIPER